jgi:peroxin-6
MLDVVPVGLDTVFVNIDTDALRKLDEVHTKFGGGFSGERPSLGKTKHLSPKKQPDQPDPKELERRWKSAVREALTVPKVVCAGTVLPLPIPSHPITHVPPPPAKVAACEPVTQGLLLPSTKIVILQSSKHGKLAKIPQLSQPSIPNGTASADEDTSNEQFYSAAEDRIASQAASSPSEEESSLTSDQLDSEASGAETDDLSDDSEDMITLDTPFLPQQSTGIMSAFTAATPRPGGAHTNGIMSPGSVYSSFTTSTVKGPGGRGKTFKAVGLTERIPDEMLHPRPGTDEDEEARIYVDTNTLVRVGCFSGDWVRMEASTEPTPFNISSWGLGGLGVEDEPVPEWRAVRVYGLPDSMSPKKQPRYPVQKSHDRRSSVMGLLHPPPASQVYLSPLLLANLGGPTHVRVSFLQQSPNAAVRSSSSKNRVPGSTLPPVAAEVAVSKLQTPLSMDKQLQNGLHKSLKTYFATKRRVIKSGDLIGISIDEALGKAISSATASEEDANNDELFSSPRRSSNAGESKDTWTPKGVVWFKVGSAEASHSQDGADDKNAEMWAGMVCVDPSSTTMKMVASEQAKLPPSTESTWPYYLGLKRPPITATPNQGLPEPPKAYIPPLRRRLRELVSAATSSRAIHLGLPPLAILIHSTQRLIGKASIATKACEDLGLHTFSIDAYDVLAADDMAARGDVKTTVLKTRAEKALGCGPQFTALLIKHIDALEADKMITTFKEILADSRVLVATTTDIDNVPEGVRGIFTHELEMNAPDEGEREGILREVINDLGIRLSSDVTLSSVAIKTAALVAGDLVDVIERAQLSRRSRLENLAISASKGSNLENLKATTRDLEIAGGSSILTVTASDLTIAVDAARKNFADSIGAPKIPNVSWQDVGGLANVKDAVMETIQLPLARPELFAKGMKKRSGILFYGPPGTGKTLLAKAIATEFSLNFFSVKGPELLNMYIGESEANVRRVFQRARDARPCVVFFDELDSVAPKRGNQGDSGGVMDRIVSQLLAELDGMSDGQEGAGGVFVIGATNRPDLLDQALLRPGRFDKMLYLGVSDTHDKQLKILEALSRKFSLDPAMSLARVAETLPFNFTGADLYALCSDAMLKAITRQSAMVDAKVNAYNKEHPDEPITIAYFFDHLATEEDTSVMVTEEDFHGARRELVPSVSMQELQHYDSVRKAFEGDSKKKAEQEQENRAAAQQKAPPPNSGKLVVGKGKGKGRTVVQGPATDDEDDYVIHTDHLKSANGSVGGPQGSGKAASGFGDAAEDDEDMYS